MCPGDDCAVAQRLPFASAIHLLEEKKGRVEKKFMKLLNCGTTPPSSLWFLLVWGRGRRF